MGSKHIGVTTHEFDLSGSRDVIGHVTIWFHIGHFLLFVIWNQASEIFNMPLANVTQWLTWPWTTS